MIKQPDQESFLQVQAILRLLDHTALGSIHDFIGNFLPPAGGKAMQEYRILTCLFHQGIVDLVFGKVPDPDLLFPFPVPCWPRHPYRQQLPL